MKEKNEKQKAPNKKVLGLLQRFLLHCSLVQFWVFVIVDWFRTVSF